MNQLVGGGTIEHGTSRLGRWLRERRLRFAFWIAFVEAILVAVFHQFGRWTVIGLAIVACALYFGAGRNSRSDGFRQTTWILAASQLLAVVAAIVAFIVIWGVIVAIIAFALVGLFIVFTDRR